MIATAVRLNHIRSVLLDTAAFELVEMRPDLSATCDQLDSSRKLDEPLLLDDGQVAHEALGRLEDLGEDDPARRRLPREHDRGRVNVEGLEVS